MQVVNRGGAAVPGVAVSWTVTAGGGSITPSTSVTDAQGVARARWTLGGRLDVTHEARATANGLPPVTFTATAKPAGDAVAEVAQCTPPPVPGSGAVNLQTDLAYSTPAGQPLRLDLAWPKTPGPHPVVVMFHGGGWTTGARSHFQTEIRQLAGAGFAAATVQYRLTSAGFTFPAQGEDARCAVRWLRTNAGAYGLDPNRIVAFGFSAGAHLALMLGTAADVPGLDGGCPHGGSPAVQGVVSYAGPTDLRTGATLPDEQQAVEDLLGGRPESVPALATLASPLAHAGAGDAPTLAVHGSADSSVPIAHSTQLRDALRASGVPATVVTLAGVPHDLWVRGVLGTRDEMRPGVCTTMAFLQGYRQP